MGNIPYSANWNIMLYVSFCCYDNNMKEVFIMKSKKGLLIGIGSAIIIAAVAVLVLFSYQTKDTHPDINIDLNGSWKVISNAGAYVEDEILEFQNGQFKDYRDGNESPYLESSYALTNDRLELKDISKVFYIAEKTDNYLIFIDDSDKSEWKVIKKPLNEMSSDGLIGDWNVVMHGDSLTANERVIYEKDSLSIYKGGSAEPSVTSNYSWKNDNTIYFDALGMDVYLYSVNDSTLIMREEQNGYVWELTKQ